MRRSDVDNDTARRILAVAPAEPQALTIANVQNDLASGMSQLVLPDAARTRQNAIPQQPQIRRRLDGTDARRRSRQESVNGTHTAG